MINKTVIFFLIFSGLFVFLFSRSITAKEDGQLKVKESISSETASQAGADNIEKDTCFDCHKKLGGELNAVVPDWKKSVHSRGGKKCNICHRGNANALTAKEAKSADFNFIGKPVKTDIIEICGSTECHSIAVSQIRKSPHYEPIIETGEPGCTSCHGKHNIQKSCKEVMTDTTCSKCHSVEYSSKLITMIFKMEDDFYTIQNDLNYLMEHNADIRAFSSVLDENRRLFVQMVHVFSRDEIENTQKIITLQNNTLIQDIKKEKAKVRRLELLYNLTIIIIVVILSGFAVYYLMLFFKRKGKVNLQ